jgi:hypothetical protein
VVRQLDREAWQWAQKAFSANRNPLPHRDKLLVSAARACSWILYSLREGSHEIWDALVETNPEFLSSIWTLIFGPQEESSPPAPICQWVQGRDEFKLRTLTPKGWVAHRDWNVSTEEFKKYLPDPGPSWRLLPKSRLTGGQTAPKDS